METFLFNLVWVLVSSLIGHFLSWWIAAPLLIALILIDGMYLFWRVMGGPLTRNGLIPRE